MSPAAALAGNGRPPSSSPHPTSVSELSSPGRSDANPSHLHRDRASFGVASSSAIGGGHSLVTQHIHPDFPSSTAAAAKNSARSATSVPATAAGVGSAAAAAAAEAATGGSAAPDKKVRRKAQPVVNPDGSVRERKKPGPKPKPKDPNASAPTRRKRGADAQQSDESNLNPQQSKLDMTRQQKITDHLVGAMPPQPNASSPRNASSTTGGPRSADAFANPNLSHVAPYNSTTNTPHHPQSHTQARPASSGQLFDPIRGATVEAHTPSRSAAHPSASPTASHQTVRLAPPPGAPSSPSGMQQPQQQHQRPYTYASSSANAAPNSNVTSAPLSSAMDVDKEPAKSVAMRKTNSGASSSAAPTPPAASKPARAKEAQPLPSGSGLLSGTPFGGLTSVPNNTEKINGTNIWLTFPLAGQTNVTINFAREVERKYGFDALHPRLAAQKQRRMQIASAGAKLDRSADAASGDDMSLDVSEAESNAEMGGIDDEASAGPQIKRRKRKAEDYDREDDFIDDTEMAWEEQALMAKDGFFVYSGPLVTEGEKPPVERADGTVKRGRGRGRGTATRGDAAARGAGRGRGARGGTTVRKPRVTKADRALMEQEKLEREKQAALLAHNRPVQFNGPAA
ncbi:HPC2-domain-containing protein [Trichodelitschia bisporula]|uniref:HPC2-domain-containing protein n=1 Tax=Trichodelitschia bisporula TaxID=703511 RepID=A0A6G1HV86_9PEZI|nr:HPC2-domain-containing protein [Trichodelitschia bisporula]